MAGSVADDANEVQYITDEDDTTEPFYSQKLAVQDQIFMSRVCEMGTRPQDML